MMPSKEFMAKERMGFKIFKRVPYGSRITWGVGVFATPEDGFNLYPPSEYGHRAESLQGPWRRGIAGYGHDVRDWFDADYPWSGTPKFKTLMGKPI